MSRYRQVDTTAEIARAEEKQRRKLGAEARHRRKRQDEERAVRDIVFARDGHRCLLRDEPTVPECSGRLTFHHRRKASAQGAYSEANGATLCLGHNGWIEDEPDAAKSVLDGYLVVRESDPEWEALGRRAARLGGAT